MARCVIWWEGMLLAEMREREGERGIERREGWGWRDRGLVRGRHATCREEGGREEGRERSLKATAESSMDKVAENVVETIIPKSSSFMNAFQLIAMSNDLDLSVLRKSKKKEEPVLEDLPKEYYDDVSAFIL
ncbi:CBL-interacting serine/threonine-protein kinase 21-like [Pyrus ussuriensis x Pyrus communis]|uniref:CBL-interacting serine/threonine-protein kinase 21-like n=1 Tax=Pyrus ussuriensis x Pyrus communis TaxID=2448454 RepID=A0A5N5HM17_9ROSA|nr:CBL-interacting serine/threonine-protein kinase 21-like [Pyrus ussuriensis x Pyrus communis]